MRVTIKRQTVVLVSTTDVYGQDLDIVDERDPHCCLEDKIEVVSELLNCSLEEAERLVLGRPGCSL